MSRLDWWDFGLLQSNEKSRERGEKNRNLMTTDTTKETRRLDMCIVTNNKGSCVARGYSFREAAWCFVYCPSLRFPPSLSLKHGAAARRGLFFSFFPTPSSHISSARSLMRESPKSKSCQFGFMKKSEALNPSVHFLRLLDSPLNYFRDWNTAASPTVLEFILFFLCCHW